MKPKRWSKSQRELIDIANDPIKKYDVVVCEVRNDFSGVSTVLRHIELESRKRKEGTDRTDCQSPLSVVLDGARPWDALMSLVRQAGQKSYGYGYLDTIWKCFEFLSDSKTPDSKTPRSLCIWLDETRYMRVWAREELLVHMEYAATRLNIPLRVVMMLGRSSVRVGGARTRVKQFIHSERINQRARICAYTNDGFHELRAEDVPIFQVVTGNADGDIVRAQKVG